MILQAFIQIMIWTESFLTRTFHFPLQSLSHQDNQRRTTMSSLESVLITLLSLSAITTNANIGEYISTKPVNVYMFTPLSRGIICPLSHRKNARRKMVKLPWILVDECFCTQETCRCFTWDKLYSIQKLPLKIGLLHYSPHSFT